MPTNETPGGVTFLKPGHLPEQPMQAMVPVTEADRVMQMIEAAQNDPMADVTKMTQLFDLFERVKDRAAKEAYNHAVSMVVSEMPKIVKNKKVLYDIDKNDKGKGQEEAFRYAALEDIDDVVKPLLKKYKLRDHYDTDPREGGGAIVICTLTHILGHSDQCRLPLPLDTSGGKNNTQGMGSTFSYGRRYTLTGILGIVVIGDDDDARSLTTLDPDTIKKIEEDLVKVGADKVKFLEFMNVDKIENILVGDLKKAKNMIEAKRKASAKKSQSRGGC